MSEHAPNIERYLHLESDFTDFLHFQGNSVQRSGQKAAFLNNEVYVPQYTYPGLSNFVHDNELANLKHSLLEASFGLYEAEDSSQKTLQLAYIHDELARMALVGAATALHGYRSSAEYESAYAAFARYNHLAYGDYDRARGGSILRTESERAQAYAPRNSLAFEIKDKLTALLPDCAVSGFGVEAPLLSEWELGSMHDEAWRRWGKELAIIPDTNNDVLYGAEECLLFLNQTLASDGLADAGWTGEISDDSIVPMTSPMKKCITLPSAIQYTASDIRRIIVGHEQKTHAWRAENGDRSGNHMLKAGTPSSMGIEEGLGILMECAIEGNLDNPSFHRARDRFITAGLALGVDGRERDAREVYEILWRIIALRESSNGAMDDIVVNQSKHSAYAHIENAFRGTPFWRKGVIYSKLKVYYEELAANASYMKSFHGDIRAALDGAMIGKYNHTSADERALFV